MEEIITDVNVSCGENCVEDVAVNSQKNNNMNKLTRKEVYKRLLMLAVPIALQNFLSALLNIVDSSMVQSLGEEQMSAVLLVNQFIFIYQVIIFAIAGASVVFISQFYGKGDSKNISPCVFLASIFVLGVSLLFTVLSLCMPMELIRLFFNPENQLILDEAARFLKAVAWSFLPFGFATLIGISLRGLQKVIMPLIVSAAVIGINFFFNYTFMFGEFGFPELKIVGAAIGTVIARCTEMIVLILVVIIKKHPIFASPKTMCKLTKDYFKKYIRLFLPACANEVFWVLGTSIYLLVFSQMDNSKSILAALNITQAVDKLVFVMLIGLGNAAGVIVGNEIGAGNNDRAVIAAKYSVGFSTIVGVGVGAITCLLTLVIKYIFPNTSAESITHAQNLMIIFGLFMVTRARTFTLIVGILRAGGDTIFCMIIETVTVWVIAVPIVLITGLVFKWSVEVIYICIYIEELVKMFIVGERFRRGKWMKNLVQNIN